MPPVLAGRYELRVRIGSGGMATVWRAVDQRLGRQVAVKVLSESLATDERFRLRFEREARHIAALLHPNIVVVYDSGTDDGRLFMVMELVQGQSLRQMLSQASPLPTALTLGLATDILAGLDHAHSAGIIHRDIKPGNILVADQGVAKLADFGISIGTSETLSLTDSGAVLGTVTYASPEQICGDTLSPASDLYSMGCVLYECVSGRPPFHSDSIAALVTQQQFADPQPLETIAPDAPTELSTVIMRALNKDPADRFASVKEMTRALGDVPGDATEHRRPAGIAGRDVAKRAALNIAVPQSTLVAPVGTSPRSPMGVSMEVPTPLSSSLASASGKRPYYKRWWFWASAAVIVALIVGGLTEASVGTHPSIGSAVGSGTAVLAGVSCSASNSCVAVGGKALLFNGRSWSNSIPTANSSDFLSAVSCVSPSFCVAVDSVGDALSFNGNTWSIPLNIDFSRSVQSVSCSTLSLCVAVDGAGNAMRFDGNTWLPAQNIDSTHFIVDVSCVGTSLCIAVDDRGDALAFGGGSWSAPLNIDSSNTLTGVSCASSRFCVAVDNAGNTTAFTGNSWVPARRIDPSRVVEGISCVSAQFCVAVDNAGNEMTFNGRSWSAPTNIDRSKILYRISCVTAKFCVAVDNAGNEITFNGKSWSAPHAIA